MNGVHTLEFANPRGVFDPEYAVRVDAMRSQSKRVIIHWTEHGYGATIESNDRDRLVNRNWSYNPSC